MKKILVIQQKMIGDVLVSSILCNNLKQAYPNSQIDYMVYESTTPVLEGNPNIDNLILFKKKHRKSRLTFLKLILTLRKEGYDVVIDSYSKLESWFTVLFLSSSRRISFKKIGRSFLYTDVIEQLEIPKSNLGLIIERRLSLLKPLDLKIEIDPMPQLYVSEKEINFTKKLFLDHRIDTSKKTVMMSIIGSSENKTLPLLEMAKIVDFVADRGDVNILFNYFPKQLKDAKYILDNCKTTTKKKIYFDVFGGSLREFIAIMNQCDVIIGNDGGAINMAKALNKPSFIIFSPWIEKAMWSTFEDGQFHKSVHLNDYMPKLFEGKSEKQLKRESLILYQSFRLNMFESELKLFLEDREKV
ncbi:MAG: glycosyltransferase family 9 protein [Urechidicola sp.]|nr:glycosyltransferase family 9 protein [Urechidicola sp.]